MGVPETLPVTTVPSASPAKSSTKGRFLRGAFAALLLVSLPHVISWGSALVSSASSASVVTEAHRPMSASAIDIALKSAACAQADPVYPSINVSTLVDGEKDQIVSWLSEAVKIPTEIFDVMGEVGEDPRWDVFYKFAEYLEKAFPLVHQHLTRTRVQTHALIFEWQGSDPSLKPLLLTGHQDVVPVLPDTRGLWTHDPYGGEFDGEKIWGRGSSDDKSGTIGALAAVELLLKSGKFTPTRTVILAFGTDEETGGKVGAYHMGQWLLEKYGPDSMAMLIDEGSGVVDIYGQKFAVPAVGEKGYMDVSLRVETPGGHSSAPPPHTGIGLISLIIAELERNPHKPYLNPESPLIGYTSCAANHAPNAPASLRKAINKVTNSIAKGKVDTHALAKVQQWWETGAAKDGIMPPGMGRSMIGTTQAVDIINGGVKINALPEVVTAIVNHRISVASSVDELQARIVKVLAPAATKLGLEVEAWGSPVDLSAYEHEARAFAADCHARAMAMGFDSEHDMHARTHMGYKSRSGAKTGKLVIDVAWNSTLNPAPVSPYTIDNPAWRIFSGTVRSVYDSRAGADGSELMVSPAVFTGNTDTKRYWALTKAIYRFAYLDMSAGFNNVHTVDEFIVADSFVEQIRWFMNLIVNVDESREL